MRNKKIITLTLCAVLLLLTAFWVSAEEVEYVVFGTYPQTEAEETQLLRDAAYDSKGDTTIGNTRYRRVLTEDGYRYFIYEPVTWQKKGNTLIALDVLDCKMYDEQEEKIMNFMGGVKYADSVTWEECSVRAWLNNEFINTAFSSADRLRISEEIRLVTVEEAQAIDKTLLCKAPTPYAISGGIELRNTSFCEWFLKDINTIVASTVCTVKNDGNINTGMIVLVNEPGIGIVPCVTLNDFSGLSSYSEKAPEKTVELYYPGGRTELFTEAGVQEALASGWYTAKADAMNANALAMKARFAASPVNASCHWRLYNSPGRAPYIIVDSPRLNMTPAEAIEFIKPIMDTFYTGNINDYMEVHVELVYDKQVAASFDEFSSTVGRAIHEAVEACWSGHGNIICSDGAAGRLTGTSGAQYTATLRLKINGDGQYSLDKTDYHRTLHTLAIEAMNYSSRPVGQLQYLRNFYGQNTLYDGRQFNNEPGSLITRGVGICGTYANFTADFCKLLGIPCIIYTNDDASHAWNGVYIEGKWYHMDHTGNRDIEFMRNFYSNYYVDGISYSFDKWGFPAEHNAENVSFLMDDYLPIQNLTEGDIAYVRSHFASSTNPITANQYIAYPPKEEIPAPEISVPAIPEKEITVMLKGEKLDFDVLPAVENGRTLVPMRKIFESLGATVYWNGDTNTATGVLGVTVVTVTVDSATMTRNGENIYLDVPARAVNSRTLVPIRAIAESFGLTVTWDGATHTVIIE